MIKAVSPLSYFSVLIVLLAVSSCQNGEEAPRQTGGTMEVEAMVIQSEELENTIHTTGSIMANEEVQLRAEVNGRVEQLNFKEGDQVKKGQLLVRIDDAQYRAQLQRVKVQLEQAERNEQRQAQLLEVEGISQEAYEEAELRVAELKAEQAELQAMLDKSSIRAPFDGRIGLRMISPGGFLSAGDNIAYLVQDNPIKIDLSVPEVYATQIAKGDVIDFVVSGHRDTLHAKVYAIEPRIERSSRSLPARARADNEEQRLIPGSFAEIKVNLASFPNAIMIPTSAVNTEVDGKSVFVLNNGRAQKRNITSGVRTETSLQVTSGLSEGDTLLLTGLLGMKEGVAVEVSNLKYNGQTAVER